MVPVQCFMTSCLVLLCKLCDYTVQKILLELVLGYMRLMDTPISICGCFHPSSTVHSKLRLYVMPPRTWTPTGGLPRLEQDLLGLSRVHRRIFGVSNLRIRIRSSRLISIWQLTGGSTPLASYSAVNNWDNIINMRLSSLTDSLRAVSLSPSLPIIVGCFLIYNHFS